MKAFKQFYDEKEKLYLQNDETIELGFKDYLINKYGYDIKNISIEDELLDYVGDLYEDYLENLTFREIKAALKQF